jgi:hypothetical protein
VWFLVLMFYAVPHQYGSAVSPIARGWNVVKEEIQRPAYPSREACTWSANTYNRHEASKRTDPGRYVIAVCRKAAEEK